MVIYLLKRSILLKPGLNYKGQFRCSSQVSTQVVPFSRMGAQKYKLASINAFILRKLPNYRPTVSKYLDLQSVKQVRDYFKRYYPFQRLTQIEKFLKRSKHYDVGFLNRVHGQIANTKSTFLSNIVKAKGVMSTSGKCTINQDLLTLGLVRVYYDIFGGKITQYTPVADEVMSQINFSASIGLVKPWIQKRQYRAEIYIIILRILNGTFDLQKEVMENPDVSPFTAAFLRNQITDSGLKCRLVFAVGYVFVVVETYFNMKIKCAMESNPKCRAIHGLTQPEISLQVKSCSSRHTLCIDYKSFDHSVPLTVLVSLFYLLLDVLSLSIYEAKLFTVSYCYFLCMPVFHPEMEMSLKVIGITSGSGYTSRIGSLCNYFMLSVVMYRYCKENGIKYSLDSFYIIVSSDDTVIDSSFKIDFDRFAKIMSDTFGMTIESEFYSAPGVNEAYFLGSKWINGKPYRNVNRMFARILFGSGNYPKMSDLQLLQSRCYEILGNSCEFSSIYRTFGLPIPNRVFRTYELSDFVTRNELSELMAKSPKKDSRGVWQQVNTSYSTLGEVWKSR